MISLNNFELNLIVEKVIIYSHGKTRKPTNKCDIISVLTMSQIV